MRSELAGALTQADYNKDVRVIVIAAAGDIFSAGQDLSENYAGGAETLSLLKEEYGPIIQRIDQSDKIVIAAVDGVCAGVGTAIALACDFVVMSQQASFYLAFIMIGLLPDGGTTWQLVQQAGYRRALEIVTSGESLNAEQALELGLVNRISMPDLALKDALNWAKQLAHQAPLALSYSQAGTKSITNWQSGTGSCL